MKRSLTLLLPALAFIDPPVHALQLVDARDGVTAEASISLKEPTRIRIDGAAITDVFGNIHSTSCGSPAAANGAGGSGAPIHPSGEIVLECDRDKGEVYVKPAGSSTKPVNLFVSSGSATYTLLLKPVDMPADTIVIRDKTPRQLQPQPGAGGRSPNHIRSLKAMLVAMAGDRVPADIRVDEVNRAVQLWVEARMSLMRLYEGRGLIGEKYLLTNISDQPMVLAEPEFDRDDGNVVAISIESHNLKSGESTSVYVIRLGG